MMFKSHGRAWVGRLSRLARRERRREALRPSLRLEALEQRTVLSFVSPVSVPAGAASSAVAVGDFNGDGLPDLINVNTSPGTVSVVLNHGDGTFGAPIVSNSGNDPVDVEVEDIDGDGHEDVVTLGSYYLSAMSVMKGNGDGTFQPPVVYPASNPPTEVQVEDMNDDGKPDLLMDNEFFNSVGVMLNNGDGTFAPRVDTLAGSLPTSDAAADFNGDGIPDLVTTFSSGAFVDVQLGNGNGTFGTPVSFPDGSDGYRVTTGDFNGDGKADLAVAAAAPANSVNILLGNGDGTFQAPAGFGLTATPQDIKTADFNDDGILDLVEPTNTGFFTEMGRGDGTFYAPESNTISNNNIAIGDFNGDGTPDIVASTGTTDTVLTNDNNNATSLAGAVTFDVSAPATSVAGFDVPVTVTPVDANGNPVTAFRGTIGISTSDPQGGNSVLTYTFTAADAGTHTFPTGVKLYTVGTDSIIVTASLMTSASRSVTVTPATATHFAINAQATSVAGTPASFTVTALDSFNNPAVNYTGTIGFTSTDGQATMPGAYTFTTADAGVHTFAATLKTVASGGQKIKANDVTTVGINGTSNAVNVTPAAATSLSLSGGGGFIGSSHAIVVTARDPFGNAATGYDGTVHITSSDTQAILPADAALSNGVGTFQWTPMTLGNMAITATDTTSPSITGTEAVAVTPGAATRFVVTPVTGVTAGTTQSFTVTAFDVFGNVSDVYNGTVAFSSSDRQAGLPTAYTFTAADAGVHTFNVTFKTAGTQTLTIADTVNLSLKSTQAGIAITPAAASSMSVTPLPSVTTAGTSIPVTVTLRDPFGNIATGYTGTLAFSSADPQATLPANYTFAAADAGVHTFNVVFKSAEDATLTIQDTVNPALFFNQGNILVNPGAVAGFAIKAPSNATAGTAFTMTVSAVDAFGNVVNNYSGKVHLSDSVSGSVLPADYAFNAADAGSHIFSITLSSTTTNKLSVVDLANSTILGTVNINVTSGSGGGGSGGGGGGGGSGGGGSGGGGKGAA